MVTGTGDISNYLLFSSQAHSANGGPGRIVDGAPGARAIAAIELTRKPAIIVFFDESDDAIVANAILSTVFDSADGASSLLFPIARYHRDGGGEVEPRDGHLPSWQGIDLDALPGIDLVEVVATTIAAFLLAATDAYWHLRTGLSPNLFARSGVGRLLDGLDDAGRGTAPSTAAAGGWGRIEGEAGRLVVKGFGVEAETLADGLIGLHATGPADIRFVLGDDYPISPPLAVSIDGTEIELDPQDWSPECSIIDIVEAAWTPDGH